MKYNDPNDNLKNYRDDFNNWIQSKIKSIDLQVENNNIYSIHFHSMIVVFENYK